MRLSITIPCYNEAPSVPLYYQAVTEAFATIKQRWQGMTLELWFVDDGSTDQTLAELKQLRQRDPQQVNYLTFSRNFGKEAALYAGLQQTTGDYVAVMDADLQDPPALLITMLEAIIDNGFDVVGTRRSDRAGEPKVRSFLSDQFYRVINAISKVKFERGVRDYRLMTRQVVNAILNLQEYNRFAKGIFSFVGFKTKYLAYPNQPRVAGETHWSFGHLLSYSLEGIIDFSEVPLAIASYAGLMTFILAILSLIFIIVRAALYGDPTAGWPSLVAIILLIGGMQLFCLGIVGKYLGRLYLESKHRPIYIPREINGERVQQEARHDG